MRRKTRRRSCLWLPMICLEADGRLAPLAVDCLLLITTEYHPQMPIAVDPSINTVHRSLLYRTSESQIAGSEDRRCRHPGSYSGPFARLALDIQVTAQIEGSLPHGGNPDPTPSRLRVDLLIEPAPVIHHLNVEVFSFCPEIYANPLGPRVAAGVD